MIRKIVDIFDRLPKSVQMIVFILSIVPMFIIGTIFNLGVLAYGLLAPDKRIEFPTIYDIRRRTGIQVGK